MKLQFENVCNCNAGGWLFPVREVTYRYNNNGNRIAKSVLMAGAAVPQDTSYTYDLENRLVRLNFSTYPILLAAKSASFDYDSTGRRIKATEGSHETIFSYDGNNVILANDIDALTEDSYTRGLDYGGGIGGIISKTRNMQTQYFHYDPQGSVTNLSSSSGSVNATYDYDAYGQTTGSWQPGQNPYRFSTKEWLGYANLYYFGRRYYDPEVGRWLTPDPLGFIDGSNLYLYVNNNPLNLVDPYGLLGKKLLSGYFLGTELGQNALNFYTNQWAQTDNPLWAVPGVFAALWTPETYGDTLTVLSLAEGAAIYEGRPFYQYYPEGNPGYTSKYLTRGFGWKPPYRVGEEASNKLALPSYNPGTAIRRVKVNPFQYLKGPQKISADNGWDGGETQYIINQ